MGPNRSEAMPVLEHTINRFKLDESLTLPESQLGNTKQNHTHMSPGKLG